MGSCQTISASLAIRGLLPPRLCGTERLADRVREQARRPNLVPRDGVRTHITRRVSLFGRDHGRPQRRLRGAFPAKRGGNPCGFFRPFKIWPLMQT